MFSRRTQWNLSINRYTRALERFRGSGRKLLDLTSSNPTAIGLQFNESELSRALARDQIFAYKPIAKGLLSARETVSAYYAEKGTAVTPDDIVLTTSTSEAYSFVFRLLCDPGDAVLVPVPSYPLFNFLADLNDICLEPYELVYDHGWQTDFASLQSAVDRSVAAGRPPRAVLIVHPNNPTGSFAKPFEIDALNEISSRHNMAVIADEVFLDYSLADYSPCTLAANSEALTFTLSGLSKISALPQMKVAWVVTSGPGSIKREALARLEIIADTYLSMNTPIQLATPAMLAERSHIQPQILERIRANLATLDEALSATSNCNRLAVEGGWYAVLRVPAIGSDEDLAILLLDTAGVLVQPGHFYDFPRDGHLVVSLITPSDDFRTGISHALDFLRRR